MSQVSNLTCLLHANKTIGWLCLEKECFSRVMCNVCAVKNHNKNHKVEELESFEQRGLLGLVLNSIKSNPSSKSITSNTNSDSSTEKFFSQGMHPLNQQSGNEKKKMSQAVESQDAQNSKLGENSQGEQLGKEDKNQQYKLKEKGANYGSESVVQPLKKRLENIMHFFKSKKLKIDKDFKEQQLRKKQQKEAAIARVKQYEVLIKGSQNVQEIQKSLDEAISIIYSLSKGSQKLSNQQISGMPQEDEDEAILLRPLSTSSGESIIRGVQEDEDDEEEDNDDDNFDLGGQSDFDDGVYELEDDLQLDGSNCLKSFPEDIESDVEVNSLFKSQKNQIEILKEGSSSEEQQNIFSESSKISQDSEIKQTAQKIEEGQQLSQPQTIISKRVYLKKKELLNQLQTYFLELTKLYFDNTFTQDFCRLVQDQIESIMAIPSGAGIKSEKKFLEFVEKKWQSDYKVLQESLHRCLHSLVSKIGEYNSSNLTHSKQSNPTNNGASNYLIQQFLSEDIQVSKLSLNEPNSRIRILQTTNYPIQSPIIQGSYTLPQIPQQVILTPMQAHQIPIHAMQNPHMQIQNRIQLEEIPANYQTGQQQYFTTVRQQGMANIINIPQPIQQQQQPQIQQQINSNSKQYPQQKYAYYQSTPQTQQTQFTKPQYISTPLNYNQLQLDQQIIQQTQIISQGGIPTQLGNFIANTQINPNNVFQPQTTYNSQNTQNMNNIEKTIQIETIPPQSHMNTPLPKQYKPEKNPYMQTTPFSHQKNTGNDNQQYEGADENLKNNNIAINLENKLNINDSEDDDPNSPIHYIQKKGSAGQNPYQTKNS